MFTIILFLLSTALMRAFFVKIYSFLKKKISKVEEKNKKIKLFQRHFHYSLSLKKSTTSQRSFQKNKCLITHSRTPKLTPTSLISNRLPLHLLRLSQLLLRRNQNYRDWNSSEPGRPSCFVGSKKFKE